MKMVRETLVTMGCHQACKAASLIHCDSVQEFLCLFLSPSTRAPLISQVCDVRSCHDASREVYPPLLLTQTV